MKSYKLIYIEWCDAMSNLSKWQSEEEIVEWADRDEWIVRQSAFVIKETKKYLLLAGAINDYDKEVPMFGHVIKIPKTWILNRIDLTNQIE